MANLRRIASKLQTALCQKGVYIKINQVQTYSEKSERMVTKYMLAEIKDNKRKSENILETYQMIDVVKCLAEIYGGE